MKKRYLYLLLFAIPALLAAAIVSSLLLGAVAGALWLFVFGDSQWPAFAESALGALLLVVGVTLWCTGLYAAYIIGKRQEARPGIDRTSLWVSAGATALLVLVIALHQFSVGNFGMRSVGAACADQCRDRGSRQAKPNPATPAPVHAVASTIKGASLRRTKSTTER